MEHNQTFEKLPLFPPLANKKKMLPEKILWKGSMSKYLRFGLFKQPVHKKDKLVDPREIFQIN